MGTLPTGAPIGQRGECCFSALGAPPCIRVQRGLKLGIGEREPNVVPKGCVAHVGRRMWAIRTTLFIG